jgi:hypothetical protein
VSDEPDTPDEGEKEEEAGAITLEVQDGVIGADSDFTDDE